MSQVTQETLLYFLVVLPAGALFWFVVSMLVKLLDSFDED